MLVPLIETRNLTKKFNGLTAVNNVSLSIEPGTHYGIIGPNGSGKTTLFNLLTGFLRPTSGQIYFNGKEITNLPIYERVKLGIARTFQLVSVFNTLSVWENFVLATVRFQEKERLPLKFFIQSAKKQEILEKCSQAMDEVGLSLKAEKRVSELSYGEKRVLEIGMVLTLKPKVLLLDEPFAGLSELEIKHISNLLSRLKHDFMLILIEHKITKIQDLVDRLIVLNEGTVIGEGPPEAVLCEKKVRECYWGIEVC